VLAFLSARCTACREAVPRLAKAAPEARRAGASVRVACLSADDGLDRALEAAGLNPGRLVLGASAIKGLNPNNAAPYYLFVARDGVLQAAGYIGDADWRAFERQLGVGV